MASVFTEEQIRAIETLDKSVLVSAAAGSGKTSVLVERIIRIILDGRANVDDLLVVTFTNAAASEMRIRLASAIRQRMADHPEEAPRMKDQLDRLYRAYISTIDSFALRVIREFFHETDLEPSFGVGDEVQCELMRIEAVNEMVEDGFEDDRFIEGGSFREFLRLYSEERSEDAFMKGILSSYNGLRSMPDYFEWAYAMAEQLKVTEDSFEGSALQKMMLDDARETFDGIMQAYREIRHLFEDAGLSAMYEDKLAPQEAAAASISSAIQGGMPGSGLEEAIKSFPSVTLRAKKDEKESYETIKADVKALRDSLKKELDGFRNRYYVPDFKARLAEMNATYGFTVYYLRLLEEFERRYDAKKHDKRVIDFADMEHIAARILKNDGAAEILRKRFRFIFVDEYQDTNNIQEHLISRIARPDNVFRVGDVKQSIYGFRQAEPVIFEHLCERYRKGMDPDGEVIDLSSNFRTNRATIDYINYVFARIMEGYDENARLNAGLYCPDEYDFAPEVHLLLDENSDTEEDAGFMDEEIEELSKEEAEADYIAGLAASIIGTDFYDTKAGTVRKAEARDIAILFRAVKYRGEVMSRALRARGIEPHIEETEDLFDTVETAVALSLFTCIDNMRRDVPLISVLHSEVFGFTPEDLAGIRTAHSAYISSLPKPEDGYVRHAYYEAFEWYAQSGPEGALKDKARAAKDSLTEWRRLSRIMPLDDFVWKVLVDSGYYRMAGAMAGGTARQANLQMLADKAGRFSRDGVATLSSFITFLELLRSKKLSNGQAPAAGSEDNVVRISTIHKSKGLEYPFVIIGGLGHKIRYDSNEKGFSFDPEAGIGLPYIDPSRKYWRSTILQRAINSKSRRDDYKEELRLLYVAMTRARNKLHMVGTCKSEEDLAKYQPRPASLLKAMKDVLKTGYNRYHVSPLTRTKSAADTVKREDIKAWLDRSLDGEGQKLYDEIDRRFGYRYPDEELLTAKAKYSVSELRQSGEERPQLRRTPRREGGGASAADIGTAYHRIMEFLDFGKVIAADGSIDRAYIDERAALLHQNSAIDDDVYAELDTGRIESFFRSSMGKRAVAASARGSLMREKPFTLRTKRDGQDMLVQGIIDCCFEEEGRMILIDYKSSYIRPGASHEDELLRIKDEYKVQIELYGEAIEKGTGLPLGEAYLYLLTSGEAIDMM